MFFSSGRGLHEGRIHDERGLLRRRVGPPPPRPAGPEPGPGEVVLKVRAVGVCDTDLQLAARLHGVPGGARPRVRRRDGRRPPGDGRDQQRLPRAARPASPDGPQHCPNRTVLGIFNHDGAMADRVRVPEREPPRGPRLHRRPRRPCSSSRWPPRSGSPNRSTSGPRSRLAILGDGKLGLLCAWVARLAGARVSLIGKHPSKLALAGEGIATHTLDEAPSARVVRRRGRLHRLDNGPADRPGAGPALAGRSCSKTTVAGTYTIDLAPIVIDEVRVIGSRCGPFPKAIDALARRTIDVRPLIGAELTLDEAEAAFRAAGAKGARKVLIHVNCRL